MRCLTTTRKMSAKHWLPAINISYFEIVYLIHFSIKAGFGCAKFYDVILLA